MASSGIVWEDRALLNRLRTFDSRADRALSVIMRYHATRATAYARQNAPWTDRTSNARNGLNAVAESGSKSHRIIIAHTVPYGIFLEVRWAGRYAIIRPTVDHEGPEVMKTVEGLFGRMFR